MCGGVLFRRQALEAVKGFDPKLRACEDYDLYLRMTHRFPVCDHDRVVAEYRRHGEAATDDPIQMLRVVLNVHASQRAAVRGRRRYEEAWCCGRAYWRDFYGRAVAAKFRNRRMQARSGLFWTLADVVALGRLGPAEGGRVLRLVLAGEQVG
jgi:hypothetical protein